MGVLREKTLLVNTLMIIKASIADAPKQHIDK